VNAATAQVHAVLWGKEAFGRLKVHGSMELLKTIIRQAGFATDYCYNCRLPYVEKNAKLQTS